MKQLSHEHHSKSEKKFPIQILLDDVCLPRNVGSIFRIADALGVEHIHLCGKTPIPPNHKIKKTARSTTKHVPYTYCENSLHAVKEIKEQDYTIISLEITTKSIPLKDVTLSKNAKVCLVLGNENYGVSKALLQESDFAIHIPMHGKGSSMNVATACGIAVYALVEKM